MASVVAYTQALKLSNEDWEDTGKIFDPAQKIQELLGMGFSPALGQTMFYAGGYVCQEPTRVVVIHEESGTLFPLWAIDAETLVGRQALRGHDCVSFWGSTLRRDIANVRCKIRPLPWRWQGCCYRTSLSRTLRTRQPHAGHRSRARHPPPPPLLRLPLLPLLPHPTSPSHRSLTMWRAFRSRQS